MTSSSCEYSKGEGRHSETHSLPPTPPHLLGVDAARQRGELADGEAQLLGGHVDRVRPREEGFDALCAPLNVVPVPLARQQRRRQPRLSSSVAAVNEPVRGGLEGGGEGGDPRARGSRDEERPALGGGDARGSAPSPQAAPQRLDYSLLGCCGSSVGEGWREGEEVGLVKHDERVSREQAEHVVADAREPGGSVDDADAQRRRAHARDASPHALRLDGAPVPPRHLQRREVPQPRRVSEEDGDPAEVEAHLR